jgi:hypothetical protein
MGVEYFDYIVVAKRCKISDEILKKLEDLERQEFPRDQMMFELHMLRMLRGIEQGFLKPEEILR